MIRKFLVLVLSIFLLLPLSVSAETEIFKIGYVVVEKILKEAPQTAASNQKLEKEFKSRTDGLQNKVKAIQKQEKDFNKNTVTMTATERQKAQKKIQNSKIEIQRIERELREDIDTVLEENMVISMEPMIMIPEGNPGAGGYREHDILIIGKDGAENITKFPFGPEHNIIQN